MLTLDALSPSFLIEKKVNLWVNSRYVVLFTYRLTLTLYLKKKLWLRICKPFIEPLRVFILDGLAGVLYVLCVLRWWLHGGINIHETNFVIFFISIFP